MACCIYSPFEITTFILYLIRYSAEFFAIFNDFFLYQPFMEMPDMNQRLAALTLGAYWSVDP